MKNNAHKATYDLLIECCRQTPDSELLETYAGRMDDWDGCLDSAYAHGVFPLVHKSLKSITAVPDEIKLCLKSTNLEIARRNMTMTAELLNIMKLLDANGIPALAIKGPVLSQMIHGDVTQRQYADLDILIEEDEIYRAGEVLIEHGYTSQHSIEFLKNITVLKVEKDFLVIDEKRNIHIELHWRLFLDREMRKSKIQLFRNTFTACKINNQIIATLDINTSLLYLLLHGSKHFWERLEWIVDIDRIIYLYPDIDWYLMQSQAKEMRVESMFYLGLAMCDELFKTKIPQMVTVEFYNNLKIMKAKRNIIEDFMSDNIHTSQKFSYLFKANLIADNTGDLIRNYFLNLFQIKAIDIYITNVPNILSPMYYISRLYRIAKFYIFKSE